MNECGTVHVFLHIDVSSRMRHSHFELIGDKLVSIYGEMGLCCVYGAMSVTVM